jgi:hypothetical protein
MENDANMLQSGEVCGSLEGSYLSFKEIPALPSGVTED